MLDIMEPTEHGTPLSLALVDTCAPGAKLRENAMFDVVPRQGIRLRGVLPKDKFARLLAAWQTIPDTYYGGLADLRRYSVEHYGEEWTRSLFVQLEFDAIDERKAAAIGQLSLDLRMESKLTSEHFYVLGTMTSARAEYAKWQALAQAEGLSAYELKRSIELGRVVRQDEIGGSASNSGFITIHAIAGDFLRWKKRAGDEDGIFALSLDNKRQLLRELEPQAALYLKLKEALSA